MINLLPGAVSLGLTGGLLLLVKKWGINDKLDYLLPLLVPISVGAVSGFSSPIVGISASLVIISGSRRLGENSKVIEYGGFLLAGFIFALAGFRIQFIQSALSGRYIYFTWLSLPLTVAWLFLISRSVEFVHEELGKNKWRLFVVTLLFIAISFILIVLLQHEQSLKPALQLGLSFVGSLAGLLVFGRGKTLAPIIFRQLGFILAAIALAGLVKSLTAFVLLVPVAPLVIPVARGSLAFTRSSNPSLINRVADRYIGSDSAGIVLIYISLSFIGPTSAWFIRDPGLLRGAILSSGLVILPGLVVLTNRVISHLESWNPALSRTGPKTGEIFGTSFNFSDLEEARSEIEELAGSGPTSYVATPDVTAVVRAENDEKLASSFARADVVTPDGFGLIWASSIHELPLENRVAGIDLVEEILGSGRQLSVYLLGSMPGVADKAAKNISKKYEKVNIVGTHHGYISTDCEEVIDDVNAAEPDLLLVGMGVPKQENWITENLDRIEANVMMGVGGSFDVFSGNLPRAPEWMRSRGLEWLYRIWLEPKRIWKARLIPYFMAKVYWEKAKLVLRNEIL